MVFTNGPANLLLVAMAFVPAGPIGSAVAVALYVVRSFLGMMDVPMRQSYVMAVVEPAERTATAGVTSLVRSGAMTAGPFVGALLLPLGLWAPIAVSGALKVGYNAILWRLFKTRLTPEEQAKRDADD
jgi:predicted MFS family arabinose efflux permease